MVACSNKSGLTNRIQRCVLLLILPCSSELFYIESPWLIAANNLKDPLQLGHGQLHHSLASYAQDAHTGTSHLGLPSARSPHLDHNAPVNNQLGTPSTTMQWHNGGRYHNDRIFYLRILRWCGLSPPLTFSTAP
jgi:hypothetical protein